MSAVCTAALSGHARLLLFFWVLVPARFFEQQHNDGLNVLLFSVTKKITLFVFSVGVCLSVTMVNTESYRKIVAGEK